jgi:hypothetical protein
MKTHLSLLSLLTLVPNAPSSPTPTQPELLAERQLTLPTKITDEAQIESIAAGLESDAAILGAAASIVIDVLEAIVPSPAPASIPDTISSVASVYAAHPSDFVVSALDLILGGLVPSDITNLVSSEGSEENSSTNDNPISPTPAVYPQRESSDAPYSLDEDSLRSAIYIPENFTYGEIPAVLLIPGTGALAGGNFGPNIGKEFQGSDYADPVYVNIPGKQLADLQIGELSFKPFPWIHSWQQLRSRICGVCGKLHISHFKQQEYLCSFMVSRVFNFSVGYDLLAIHQAYRFRLYTYQW